MCPRCQSKYYILIDSINGIEYYRCSVCGCEWKWENGERAIVNDQRSEVKELLKQPHSINMLDF